MSTEQEKWDARYSEPGAQPKVAGVLLENASLLPSQGLALDVACGLGGNALFLAEQGLEVEAWDISPVAIEKLNHAIAGLPIKVQARVIDTTETDWPTNAFDVIVVSYYLERRIVRKLVTALKPGGLLFYETFNQNMLGRGPSNPAYRLEEHELLKLFDKLKILYYREESDSDMAMLVSKKS